MPVYEYECRQCGHRFEIYQGILEDKLKVCRNRDCEAEQLHRIPGKGGGVCIKGTSKGEHAKPHSPHRETWRK